MMEGFSGPGEQESDDEYNEQETLNLLNLIKHDLEEDGEVDESFHQHNAQGFSIANNGTEDNDCACGGTNDFHAYACNDRELKNSGDEILAKFLEVLGTEYDDPGVVQTNTIAGNAPDLSDQTHHSQITDTTVLQTNSSENESYANETTPNAYVDNGCQNTSAASGFQDPSAELTDETEKHPHSEKSESDGYSTVSDVEHSEASDEEDDHLDTELATNDVVEPNSLTQSETEVIDDHSTNDVAYEEDNKTNFQEDGLVVNEMLKEGVQFPTDRQMVGESFVTEDANFPQRLRAVQLQVEEEKKKYSELLQQLDSEQMEKAKLRNNLHTLLGRYYDKLNTEDELKSLVSDMEDDAGIEITPKHIEEDSSLVHKYYRKEILLLEERLRNTVATNERVEGELRASISEEHENHELERKAMEEEIETQKIKVREYEEKTQQLLHHIDQMKSDLSVRTEQYKATQVSLQKTQLISDQRKRELKEAKEKLASITSELSEVQKNALGKDEEIVRLQTQVKYKEDAMAAQKEEMEKLKKKLLRLEKLKMRYKELKLTMKKTEDNANVRGDKVKLLKRHVKQLQEDKEKVQRVADTVPAFQQRIVQLQETIETMKQQVLDKQREEAEQLRRKLKAEEDKKIKLEKEKKEWERRTLGIGTCLEPHGEPSSEMPSSADSTPNTTPLFKPRPPSSEQSSSQSLQRKVINLPSSVPLNYLEDHKSPNRKSTINRQQDTIKSNTSKTKSCKRNLGYRVSAKGTTHHKPFMPRVLEWGDGGSIDQALAVGNQVICNIRRECDDHGNSIQQQKGVVRFIGFVQDNEEDVYIGARLEKGVGWTDGVVHGQRYFKCEKQHGAFVRLGDIIEKVDSSKGHLPHLKMGNSEEIKLK